MSGRQNWPAFLAYISGSSDSGYGGPGSGVVVTPDHLLTCAHVVFHEYPKSGYPDVLNPRQTIIKNNEEIARRCGAGQEVAKITLVDGTVRRGLFKAVHPSSDIVLLELDPPANFVAPLPLGDGAGDAEFCAYGFVGSGIGRFAPTQCTQSWLNRVAVDEHFPALSNAAEEGMSGGPLIRYFGSPERPVLCGLTVLGGMQIDHGRGEVHSKLRTFMEGNGVQAAQASPDAGSPNCDRDGFLSSIALKLDNGPGCSELVLDRRARGATDPVCYVARRPFTIAELSALSGAAISDRALWEAGMATLAEIGPDEVDPLLERFASVSGFGNAHLPNRDHLQTHLQSHLATGGAPSDLLCGPTPNAPITVENLWGSARAMQGLGVGGAEWCCDKPGASPEQYGLTIGRDHNVLRYVVARERGCLNEGRACVRPAVEIHHD